MAAAHVHYGAARTGVWALPRRPIGKVRGLTSLCSPSSSFDSSIGFSFRLRSPPRAVGSVARLKRFSSSFPSRFASGRFAILFPRTC
jgi:hypothetical protein